MYVLIPGIDTVPNAATPREDSPSRYITRGEGVWYRRKTPGLYVILSGAVRSAEHTSRRE